MLHFNVEQNLDKALSQLDAIAGKQLPFAVAKTLTQTAKEIQTEVKRSMPRNFTLRRNWIVQGIRIIPATKTNLTAVVYSKDYFMGIQETGGEKRPGRSTKYLAIPTTLVRRTKKDNIRMAERPKALMSSGKAEVVTVGRRRYIALKKPRRGRNGNMLRLMYLLIPSANLQERLQLVVTGKKTANDKFNDLLGKNLADAIARPRAW